MTRYPKITVVTPSLNQGEFLEQTILSVLEQNYKNLEYIVIDGGSQDSSVEIIKKYEKYLAYWITEKDNGQAEAIAKGFRHATGEILAWLNSDDQYCPDALQTVGQYFCQNPEVDLLYGDYYLLYPDGKHKLKKKIDFDYAIALYCYLMIPQPSAFWRRTIYDAVGGMDISLSYAMDYDLFLRIACLGRVEHFKHPLSVFRLHSQSKSVAHSDRFAEENSLVQKKHLPESLLRSPFFYLKRYFLLLKTVILFFCQRGMIVYKKEQV